MYQEDPDEIQEVVPVKEEPRQHHQVAMEEQQQEVIDNSGAMEQYGAEGDYGEYEGYEGEYDQGGMGDASMVGGDGNKGKISFIHHLCWGVSHRKNLLKFKKKKRIIIIWRLSSLHFL